ncbi:MAG: HIRAN domain-containing protein [Saccharofermentans sp.]|nr:HIRAN domain-containing protein [Saccharofermentans sp.]
MEKIYITITGTQFRHGCDWLRRGDIVRLVKEPDNKYDNEAIKVVVEPFGTIGYVANSTKTVIGTCYSAGRLYDKIGDEAEAKVKYVLDDSAVVCKVKV